MLPMTPLSLPSSLLRSQHLEETDKDWALPGKIGAGSAWAVAAAVVDEQEMEIWSRFDGPGYSVGDL